MVFKSSTRIFVLIIVLLLMAYSFIGYLGQNINSIYLDDFYVDSLNNVSYSSFNLKGNFFFENPTGLMIPVRIIRFDVLLDGEVISSGFISSFRLGAGQISRVGFEQNIKHDLSSLNLSSVVKVEGVITLDFLFTPEYRIPFSDQKMLSQIVPSELLSTSEDGVLVIVS